MGVRHLKDLRRYLKEHPERSFSRTELRDTLKQNYPTIIDNLAYLMDQEGRVMEVGDATKKYQWRNT